MVNSLVYAFATGKGDIDPSFFFADSSDFNTLIVHKNFKILPNIVKSKSTAPMRLNIIDNYYYRLWYFEYARPSEEDELTITLNIF